MNEIDADFSYTMSGTGYWATVTNSRGIKTVFVLSDSDRENIVILKSPPTIVYRKYRSWKHACEDSPLSVGSKARLRKLIAQESTWVGRMRLLHALVYSWALTNRENDQ